MRRLGLVLVIVGCLGLTLMTIARCTRAEEPTILPSTMKTYYVAGSRTPEAILLEADWLDPGEGPRARLPVWTKGIPTNWTIVK